MCVHMYFKYMCFSWYLVEISAVAYKHLAVNVNVSQKSKNEKKNQASSVIN